MSEFELFIVVFVIALGCVGVIFTVLAIINYIARVPVDLNHETWPKMSRWRKRRVVRGLAGNYNFRSGS